MKGQRGGTRGPHGGFHLVLAPKNRYGAHVTKRQILISLRWLTAAGIGVLTLKLLIGASKATSLTAGFAGAVFGFSALILTVIIVAPELVAWATTPVHRAINSLIFPGGTIVPPADYKLARLYRKQWRYKESVDEYFKILEYHPDELSAYLEGIATAAEARAPKTRERFYRLGLRKLRAASDRDQLQQAFAESVSGRVADAAPALDRE